MLFFVKTSLFNNMHLMWTKPREEENSPFGCADPYPKSTTYAVKSSIILVASDRDLSLTLSGVPALCVKAFAPHSSHTIFEVIIIKSLPLPERYSKATHYVIFSKTFTFHLWNFPWSVDDVRCSIQNILIQIECRNTWSAVVLWLSWKDLTRL